MWVRSVPIAVVGVAVTWFCAYGTCRGQNALQPAGAEGAEGETRIAVVDLDRAARELGWMDAMHKDMEQCASLLQADVKKFTGIYNDELKSVAQGGQNKKEPPTTAPGTPTELARDTAIARQQVGQLRQKADQLYAGYRSSLAGSYRQALLPLVKQISHDRKFTLVLARNDSVLLAAPEVDITGAVIEAARNKMPVVTPVPMPRLEAPLDLGFPAAPTTEPSQKPAGG
jgi:Skp family chaperone for outer membrane proteins